MAGGLFAINRQYYWELGAYDEQMAGWGGREPGDVVPDMAVSKATYIRIPSPLDIKFKTIKSGGTLETVPCSRVGHVFRAFHPYGLPAHTDTHGTHRLTLYTASTAHNTLGTGHYTRQI
ncbi:n-acetylgalactosaminyltransferase [Danaus plexippus plexippus]|uniref:N-acetylgalactosaminyltransferase n=1 Tax=Danaus plexippus plexippus TaxID=278856 RepID=A0A212ET04_DANPL|nr:n-acetylgalactosaminyltransferase [Danaus plexippus plexippus]